LAGCVVPKRHARRAVTRSLVKRAIRGALARHETRLPPGLWVIRLSASIDRARYISAASEPLRRAMRAELDALITRALA
jgi:ribonuclease P protein component